MSCSHCAHPPRVQLASAFRQVFIIAVGFSVFTGGSPALRAQTEYALDPAPAFTIRSRGDTVINQARELADGRIMMSGNIRYVDGHPSGVFFRLLSNGEFDPSFVAHTDSMGRWTQAANGGFFAHGAFVPNSAQQAIALLTADGALDPAFSPLDVTGLGIREIIGLPDGGFYLVSSTSTNVWSVRRFTATGQPYVGYPAVVTAGTGFITVAPGPAGQLAFLRPNSAGPAAISVIDGAGIAQPPLASIPTNFRPFGLVYQPDGALVLSGQTFSGVGPGLIRILPDGQRDLTFTGISPFNNFGGSSIARLADGSFVSLNSNGVPASQPQVLRFSGTGSYLPAASLFLDNGSDGNPINIIFLPLADGDFLVMGRFLNVNGTLAPTAARVSPAGDVRAGFYADLLTRGRVTAIAPIGAGGQLLAGTFTEIGEANPRNLAVLTETDAITTGVPPLPSGSPNQRILATVDGGAIVMGVFPAFPGTSTNGLVKLQADGQIDTSFLAGVTLSNFEAGAKLPDGGVVLVGRFGAPPTPAPAASYMMRVLPTGAIDSSFNNHSTVSGNAGVLTTVAAAPDGSLLVAGSFTTFQGLPRRGLARTFANGMIDPSFAPAVGLAPNAMPRQLSVLPDGRFYVLGARDDVPGSSNRLLRFNADGSIDESFAPETGRATVAYALAADGSLFAAFAGLPPANGNPAISLRLVKLAPSGATETVLSEQLDAIVSTLVVDELDRLLVGGLFTSINGQPREALARFSPLPFGIVIDGPAELAVLKHSTVILTTDVISAPGPVSYQWYQDGEALAGQTGASLVLTHIVPKHGGDYTVTATAGVETVTSAPVRLVVLKGKPEKH